MQPPRVQAPRASEAHTADAPSSIISRRGKGCLDAPDEQQARQPAAGSAQAQRILVRLPNWVGDVVMATPALAALRAHHPSAHIAVEGRPFLAGLVTSLPMVDEFLPDSEQGVGGTWRRTRRLRAGRFDLAVLLPDSARAAVAPFLARIPTRIGYARDAARRALMTHPLDPPRKHGKRLPIPMVLRYLAITRALGCPDADTNTSLQLDPAASLRVTDMLVRAGVSPDEELAVLTPGAHFGSSKLYPAPLFAQVIGGLSARLGLRVVLAPAPSEVELAHVIADAAAPAPERRPVVLDQPPTSLAELAALIHRARLVLSNDTGPRHMAVALGTPTVVLMGPTDPRHTEFQLERQRVLREDVDCSPCHLKVCPIDHRCMTRIAPQRVVDAAAELLS